MSSSDPGTVRKPYFLLKDVLPSLKEAEGRLLVHLISTTCSPSSKRDKMAEGHLKKEVPLHPATFFLALSSLRRKRLIYRFSEEVKGKKKKFYRVVLNMPKSLKKVGGNS